jgi:hypothetical protein
MIIDIPDISYWNLVVRIDESSPMDNGRMLERTAPDVKEGLFPRGGYDLQTLAALPVVMTKEFEEGDGEAEAIVGYMDFPSLNPLIFHPIMRIKSQALLDCGFLSRWENHRTHWAIRRGNPFRQLSAYAISPSDSRQGLVTKPRQLAVMMPFDKGPADDDPVYRAIREGASKAGFECRRVDELTGPADITEDIRILIAESGAVIADVTEMNANVMYEFGYAHGLGKTVYVIAEKADMDKLPFDVRQRRAIPYSRKDYGLAELSENLARQLQGLAGRSDVTGK